MAYDESTAARVRAVLAGQGKVVEKKMMGGLCFMVRGGMCCSVSGKGGLLVRVDPASYPAALREPHVQPMKMGKRVMSGFVRVAPGGYRTTEELRAWVLRGVAGVVSRAASARPRTRRKKPGRRRGRD
jgi:TfoX/Sxy family transcriptional regulator of competence genes